MRTATRQPRAPRPRGGFILIAVLIVIMLCSMVVVSLLFRVRAEETATAAGAGSEQAWAAAISGVYEAMRVASKSAPGSLDWYDNPAAFRERLVFDEGADRWFFSVYSAGEADAAEVRFGLTDEASKLNINEATEEMFEKLPKMTPYLVQGLLDFLDTDDTPRPEGAEQEYYDALPTPYAIANGPLATLEQLMLVRGFTPALFYGEDANWNFLLDPNEDDGESLFPPDNKDGKLDMGLRQYLTVSSYDQDVDNEGAPRVDLNAGSEPMASTTTTTTTTTITTTTTTASGTGKAEELPAPALAYLEALHRNKIKLEQPADLLEAKGKFKGEDGKEVEMESGVGKEELPLVLDRFTTRTESRVAGLVDVNTASSRVLQCLPGIDEALADSIVAARHNLRAEQRRTPAWLYQEGVMDAGQFKKVAPHLTARGFQFHLHVIGYGVPSGRYRVLEAIIDTAGAKPTISFLREITRLGVPFKIESNGESEDSNPGEHAPADAQPSPASPATRAHLSVHSSTHG